MVSITNQGRDHRYSPIICRSCAQPGHIQSQCWFRPVPQRETHVPFATIPKVNTQQQPFLTALANSSYNSVPITGTNLFYLPLHFQGYCFKILIDTGAFSSALSKTILQQITQNKTACVTKLPTNFLERVYVADGKKVRVLGKVLIELMVGLNTYSEQFLVLDQMSTAILGNPFFIKDQIVIDPSKKLLYFPDVTLRLNSIGNKENSKQQVLITVSKTTLKPNYQDIVEVSILKPDIAFNYAIEINEPSSLFEKKSSLCVTSSINKLDSHEER